MKRLSLVVLPLLALACGPQAQSHSPVAEEAIPADTSSPSTIPSLLGDGGTDDNGGGPTAVPPPDAPTQVDAPDDAKTDPPAGDSVAVKLDARNGFATGTFGDAPKAYKGLKQTKKDADHTVYKVGGKNQYAGVTLTSLEYTFMKDKLAKIAFGVGSKDCKTVHDAFERDYGTAQKHLTAPAQADVWRGNDVALRFNTTASSCSGVMVRKDAAPTEWTGIDQ
ncbi:MAG TPA: hypothetical protein VF407_08520 [Polyangiaceae bacterium]